MLDCFDNQLHNVLNLDLIVQAHRLYSIVEHIEAEGAGGSQDLRPGGYCLTDALVG